MLGNVQEKISLKMVLTNENARKASFLSEMNDK